MVICLLLETSLLHLPFYLVFVSVYDCRQYVLLYNTHMQNVVKYMYFQCEQMAATHLLICTVQRPRHILHQRRYEVKQHLHFAFASHQGTGLQNGLYNGHCHLFAGGGAEQAQHAGVVVQTQHCHGIVGVQRNGKQTDDLLFCL